MSSSPTRNPLLATVTVGLVAQLVACTVPLNESPLARHQQKGEVCAEGPILRGIDVSAWQGDALNWDAIASGGDAEFVFIRASHGLVGDGFNDGPDAHFDLNWGEAGRVGLFRGAYQYFITTEDPIVQADFLLDKIGPMQSGDLPPVIDVEFRDVDPLATVPEIIAGVGQWLAHIEAELGVKPIVYTSQSMWTQMTEDSSMFADYPLWTAHYGTDCPLTPGGWSKWSFHQYSSTGGIVGYDGDIDKNRFMGTIDDLRALAQPLIVDEPDAAPPVEPIAPDAGAELPVGDLVSSCSTSGASGPLAAFLLLVLLTLLGPRRRRRALRGRTSAQLGPSRD